MIGILGFPINAEKTLCIVWAGAWSQDLEKLSRALSTIKMTRSTPYQEQQEQAGNIAKRNDMVHKLVHSSRFLHEDQLGDLRERHSRKLLGTTWPCSFHFCIFVRMTANRVSRRVLISMNMLNNILFEHFLPGRTSSKNNFNVFCTEDTTGSGRPPALPAALDATSSLKATLHRSSGNLLRLLTSN